mgnify:CR=1 FL=1
MIFLMFSANFLAYNPVPVLMLRLSGSSGLYEIEGMSDKKTLMFLMFVTYLWIRAAVKRPLFF